MHHALKQKAIYLRTEKQLSYNAILKEVPVAKSTLSEWLKHYPLSKEKILELRRTAWTNNQAKIELFRTTMREKRENRLKEVYTDYLKKFENTADEALFIAGLMLYLAEGSKKDYSRIVMTNTDPSIIKFFINWLNTFFGVPRKNLKAQLHLYENMDVEVEKVFWKNQLHFTDSQFFKNQIRKLTNASFSYQESFRHGTCALYFGSVEKKMQLMMATKAFMDTHSK